MSWNPEKPKNFKIRRAPLHSPETITRTQKTQNPATLTQSQLSNKGSLRLLKHISRTRNTQTSTDFHKIQNKRKDPKMLLLENEPKSL